MNKVIFLDIDGVLNTTGDKNLLYDMIDELKLNYLISLSNNTNSSIIITSDRRVYEDERKDIDLIFSSRTKDYSYLSLKRTDRLRSDEIIRYLNNNKVDNFVILDDNDLGYSDNELLKNHFIDTSKNGFLIEEFEEAYKILGGDRYEENYTSKELYKR